MTLPPRPAHGGLRHVALYIEPFEACLHFYGEVLGFAVEWQPDEDNAFLCSGIDNLALHRRAGSPSEAQRLDHIGLIVDDEGDVDRWHAYLLAHDVTIAQGPKKHRDGARSLYCYDPAGTLVQLIYHPPLSKGPALP